MSYEVKVSNNTIVVDANTTIHKVDTTKNSYEVSLSRTGGQGSKGDSVTDTYFTEDGRLIFVISNSAGEIVEEIDAGSLILANFKTDYIDFTPDNVIESIQGRVWYNNEDDTLNIGHDNDVIQQVGQESFIPPVNNKSGEEIPNGVFVMATGVQGDRITIAKAITDGSVGPEYMLGIATSTISNGEENGKVVTNGIVRGIDTSTWDVGTVLYPDPNNAGSLTSVMPEAPAIRTPVAIVLRKHANTGRIYVRMTLSSTLGGTDSNVKFSDLEDNDFIIYNATTGVWENKSLIAGSNLSSINTTNAITLDVSDSPSFTAVTAEEFITTSDITLKENIKPLEDSLTKVLGLRGVEFDWKDSERHDIGFIAQEVENTSPELVTTDINTGIKAVKYSNTVALLVEAIKELHEEVVELKSQLNNNLPCK